MLLPSIFVVWFLTGMWHGATVNFVLWGLYFCFFLIMEKTWLLKVLERLPRFFSHVYALVIIYFGWLLFAWEDIPKHRVYLKAMAGIGEGGLINRETMYLLVSNAVLLLIFAVGSTSLPKKVAAVVIKKEGLKISIFQSIYVVILFVLSIAYLVNGTYNPFLYFRF